jgi:hypothetical protein
VSIEKHEPICVHCKSAEATDVEYFEREISAGTWQPGGHSRSVARVGFTCGRCGKPNEYDVPQS